ncbi:hypothetical protein BDY19DRAFT_889764 [Irpex rosettiformis]|uniref:Uncharacterized protein n=1 Tax=Irpex rosettiformis TaxID=378272 RepID=A0ACB8U4E2_9APHY|nr:hypothetical protein BDY19DRAFT_889764 [Irpex rosettiformis]
MSTKFDGGHDTRYRRVSRRTPVLLLTLCAAVATLTVYACNFYLVTSSRDAPARLQHIPFNAQAILQQCASIKAVPGPKPDFHLRAKSDRFEEGTRPTLIKNAHILTGARNGTETVVGDVLLSGGVVRGIGDLPDYVLDELTDLVTIEAEGAWVTPGLIDLHSHVGLLSSPATTGAFDVNSLHGPILPWLRSIDAFNTHDDAFQLAIAGGVTSAQVLPGSGNAIGGQAFMFKLRKTADRSPSSMVIEPPHTLNGSQPDPDAPLRWRHMKQACGENLSKYGTRMDTLWAFRSAYNEARKVKSLQDNFCMKAENGMWDEIHGQEFPESLKWEMLVDVLRGRVKVSNHCYEEVDLDDIVRLTNEFEFPIASFHHASEAWLVPDVLKRAWGGTPTISLFATVGRMKREAYRASPFAPRILADNDIPVSDHPIINSRYLMHEAQQAHHFGLPPHLALASVTSTPARAAGLLHRIGLLREGSDADVVLWDSHPLHLGATPQQVWIDGIPQLSPSTAPSQKKGSFFEQPPRVPNYDAERKEAWDMEGLPDLSAKEVKRGKVVLKNVESVWIRTEEGVRERWAAQPGKHLGAVVFVRGTVACIGEEGWCLTSTANDSSESEADGGNMGPEDIEIDLQGGSVGPGLMTFGSPIGIEEIPQEGSTGDGPLVDAFRGNAPSILNDVGGLTRAVDALQFGTRDALIAHRAGVTYATSSLGKYTIFSGPQQIIAGLATTFRTGAAHALEAGAVVKPVTALRMYIGRPSPWLTVTPIVSVSTQIAGLRRLLLNGVSDDQETGRWFKKAADGSIPLIIEVNNADIMATLLQLKKEIEDLRGVRMNMVFSGATEAHLLANEIARARVGVILHPARPFPATWDNHRILAGPPLTNETAVGTLFKAGVTVALGITDSWEVVATGWNAGWATLESNGLVDKYRRYDLVTANLEKLLGVQGYFGGEGELVIYQGGDAFNLSSKVVGIAAPKNGLVELF